MRWFSKVRNYIILSFFLSPSFLFGKFFLGTHKHGPRACLAPKTTVMNRMPFFAHASDFTIKDSHISEVGGDYFNIQFAMPAESTGWFGISMFHWSYWMKCPERIATQLLGKRKVHDLDQGDAEADGPRKRFKEVRNDILDSLMVRFLSWIIPLDEFLFRFIDCTSKGHRLA